MKKNFESILVSILFVTIIYSSIGLNGFLQGHLGWLGPHLYSASINIAETKYFVADGIIEDNSFHLYNHHPPLFFYLYYLISQLGNSLGDKLQIGYFFSSLIYAFSWISLYVIFRSQNFNKSILAVSIFIAISSDFFTRYRVVLSFDIFSILISIFLYLFLLKLISKQEFQRKELIIYSIYLSICLLTSYYPLFVLFIGYIYTFIYKCYNKQEIKQLLYFCFITSLVTILNFIRIILTTYISNNDWDVFNSFLSRTIGSGTVTAEKRLLENQYFIERIVKQLEALLPDELYLVIILLFILKLGSQFYIFCRKNHRGIGLSLKSKKFIFHNYERKKLSNSRHVHVNVNVIFILGILMFYSVAPYWAAVHPFSLLLLSCPIVLIIYFLIENLRLNKLILQILAVLVLFFVSSNFHIERIKDINFSKKTKPIISLFEKNFSNNLSIERIRGRCGYFNGGMFKFLASSPNKWAYDKSNNNYEQITLECLKKEEGDILFKNNNSGAEFVYYGKSQMIVRKK